MASGLSVSPCTTHRLVASVGPDMEKWALGRPPDSIEDGREVVVCLERDMTGVRMLKKYLDGAKGKGLAAEALFERWRHKLKVYGVDCVIRHFVSLEVKPRKRSGVRKRQRYFKGHRDRMQYRRFRSEGWPTGSGAIEGACKSLIKQRTDLSGQRWSPGGARDVLCVRALITDGLHAACWNGVRDREAIVRAAVFAA